MSYTPSKQSEQVSGGCFCGSVRYEARAYIRDAYYCHCRICQKISGAPAGMGVFVEPGSLRFTKGEPQFFPTSHFGERGFCRDCGSRLIWRHIGTQHPEYTNLDVGCMDHPEQVVPTSHQCVESQLPWYRFDDGLPRLRSEEIPELVALWESASKTK